MEQYKPAIDYTWNDEPLENILERHKQWVETKGIEGDRAIVTGANLTQINLEYADLRASIFEDSDFSGGNLLSVTFRGAKLRRTSFARALLQWAVLRFSDMTEADFSEADLYNALNFMFRI